MRLECDLSHGFSDSLFPRVSEQLDGPVYSSLLEAKCPRHIAGKYSNRTDLVMCSLVLQFEHARIIAEGSGDILLDFLTESSISEIDNSDRHFATKVIPHFMYLLAHDELTWSAAIVVCRINLGLYGDAATKGLSEIFFWRFRDLALAGKSVESLKYIAQAVDQKHPGFWRDIVRRTSRYLASVGAPPSNFN